MTSLHAQREPENAARHSRGSRRLRPLEWITVLHLSIFAIAASWAFGGQAASVRSWLVDWGCAGALITVAGLLESNRTHEPLRRAIWWWAPLLLFNAVTLVAALNPSFRPIHYESETLLVAEGARRGWPSCAVPELAREALRTFDAIWISAFNIAVVLRRRRGILAILTVCAINAVVLAVFGTLQKVLGATGIFFGSVPTPQKYFFASFVYHNHWGAFMLLMIALWLGLAWHLHRRREARDFFHSPSFGACIAVLLLAVTIPLSASRSSTALGAILCAGAFLHWSTIVIKERRRFRESILPPLGGALFVVALAFSAIVYLAHDTIAARFHLTVQQVNFARTSAAPDPRMQLYSDTWRMARAKPWFGWGMASYPHVFTLFNTRESVDRLPVFYHDAHSDWLQTLAEHGVVGTTLLALCAIIPLTLVWGRRSGSPLPGYLFGGCLLVVVYALFEFPFGNFAVVLTWWICFFSAVQYMRLTATPATSPDVAHA